MVSGSNVQRSGRHSKENQHSCEVKVVVECRHQRKKNDGRERHGKKTELGAGCLGEGRAPEIDPAIQEKNVERLLAEP